MYFNPRTPVGCDRNEWCRHSPQPHFNPRTPVGCDFPYTAALGNVYEFQSTHPSGVRLAGGIGQTGQRRISIHAPQWGATPNIGALVEFPEFQSTHPSGVRLDGVSHPVREVGISIHAPQWGATDQFLPLRHAGGISIHAPQWGATVCGRFSTRFTVVFQSTHPSGVRHSLCHPVLPLLGISIHAPQWGATDAAREPFTLSHISIHAPQWGATWRGTRRPSFWDDFNPRTPVGCDAVCVITMATDLFQSTHPSGVRRADGQGRGRPLQISIHAPQWGATARLGQAGVHRPISIHAPQWGATTITSIGKSGAGDFNPRTPVGCDLHQLDVQLNIIKFQSTHPSGVRRVYYLQSHVTRHISIHAPQWGATWCSACLRRPAVYFNPRTPVGCDHPVSAGQVHSAISIHAPQWGATEYRNAIINVDMISIHAPQWGATES